MATADTESAMLPRGILEFIPNVQSAPVLDTHLRERIEDDVNKALGTIADMYLTDQEKQEIRPRQRGTFRVEYSSKGFGFTQQQYIASADYYASSQAHVQLSHGITANFESNTKITVSRRFLATASGRNNEISVHCGRDRSNHFWGYTEISVPNGSTKGSIVILRDANGNIELSLRGPTGPKFAQRISDLMGVQISPKMIKDGTYTQEWANNLYENARSMLFFNERVDDNSGSLANTNEQM